MADETVQVVIQGDASQAVEATSSVGEAMEQMRSQISAAIDATGFVVAYEAIKRVSEALIKLGEDAIEIRTMSDVIGVSTSQFQAMQAAAEETGVGMSIFERSLEKIKTLLADARDGSGAAIEKLHEMGVTNEQIADKQFSVNDALGVLHTRLDDAATAQSTMNALTKEFGGRAAAVVEAIKAYDGSLDGVKEKMAAVNGYSDQQIDRLKSMATWWKEIGTWAEHAAGKIAIAMTDSMSAHHNLSGTESSADLLDAAGANGSGGGASGATSQQQEQLQQIQVTAQKVSTAITAATLQSEQAQIAATASGTSARIALTKQFYLDSLTFYGSGTVDAVRKAFAEMLSAQREYDSATTESLKKQAADAKQKYGDDVAQYREAVAKMEAGMKELTGVAEGEAKQTLAAQLGGINAAQNALQAAASRHEITAQQELQGTQALLGQELIANMAFLQTKEVLDANNAAQMAANAAKEVQTQQKYLLDMQKAQETYAANIQRSWQTMSNGMTSSITSALNGVLNRSESLTRAMTTMFAKMGENIIGTFVKIAVQQAVNAAISKATGVAAAKSNTMANASQAASGAMASAATIPYVGWILAPIAGAAVYAAALAFPSAEGGFDIPRGVNPITQLHSNEMVLPSHLADGVRAMTAGGGGGGDTHNHSWNINALDGHSVKQFLRDPSNRRMFQAAVSG